MPGLRIREDGWTVARTRTFLAALTQTGCVTDAARVAGISRKSVNDARGRFAAFDRACSTALARAGRGLRAIAYERAVVGGETVVKRGEMGDGNEDGGTAALPPLRMRKRRRPCGQRRLSGQGCYRQA